jgi:proliferating cell nuclear antigen
MLLKLDNPKDLVDSISVISELVTEATIKVNKEGLSIEAFDPANVALVNFRMPSSSFSQFDIEGDEDLGINLDDFKQVLRRATAGSSLVIKKDKENMLDLEIKNKINRSFSLALINSTKEERKAQDLKFSSEVELPVDIFSDAITDGAIVADACYFITDKDSFAIEAKGSLNKTKTNLTKNEAKISGNGKAKYSLEYLQKFIKASKIANNVKVSFSSDYPLKLEFKDKVELSFILAPRVEEDE